MGHNLKISRCRHTCNFRLTKNISCTICRHVYYLSAYKISLSYKQSSLSYFPLNKTKYIFFTAPTGIRSPDRPARSKLLYQLRYKPIILPVVLHGCGIWSLTLREECRLRVFENRVFRRIFGPKRDEVIVV